MVICPRPHTQQVQSEIQTQACLSQGKGSRQRSGRGKIHWVHGGQPAPMYNDKALGR